MLRARLVASTEGTTLRTSTAASELDRLTGGVRVSAHVPAVASTKQNNIIRLGMRRDMISPIWEGLTLIPDETHPGNKIWRGNRNGQSSYTR